MAIPANLDTVTVTGSYISADGTALTGTVTFTPTLWLRDGTGDVVIPQAPVVATLDETGAFSEVLVATDDTDVDQNWAYLVTETINGISESKTILLPASLVTVDMSELEPVVDTAVYEDMRGPRGFSVLNGSGAPTSAVGEDGDFYIDTASQAIYGPKSGASWGSATSLVAALGSSTPQPLGSAAAGTSTSAARADHVHSSTVANPTFSGVAAFPDGSASAPSVTNDGDTDTGLFFPAADQVAITTGGTMRLRVGSTGNVGIDTTSPQRALSVGNDGAIALQSPDSTVGEKGVITWLIKDNSEGARISASRTALSNAPHQLAFFVRNESGSMLERMRIDPNGLITGTGTSLGAWTAYTPTLGGTGWAIGDGTALGKYCQIGKIVHFRIRITFGATSTYGAASTPTVSLPVTAMLTPPSVTSAVMPAMLYDTSGSVRYASGAFVTAGTTMTLMAPGTLGVQTGITSTVPFTWETGDWIGIHGTYEAA